MLQVSEERVKKMFTFPKQVVILSLALAYEIEEEGDKVETLYTFVGIS